MSCLYDFCQLSALEALQRLGFVCVCWVFVCGFLFLLGFFVCVVFVWFWVFVGFFFVLLFLGGFLLFLLGFFVLVICFASDQTPCNLCRYSILAMRGVIAGQVLFSARL